MGAHTGMDRKKAGGADMRNEQMVMGAMTITQVPKVKDTEEF